MFRDQTDPPANPKDVEMDDAARQELVRLRAEKEQLELQLNILEKRTASLLERCAWAEQQAGNIARLYTAVCRLNEVRDRAESLEAIQEIVINFFGSEELGIYELQPDGKTMVLKASMGIDREVLGRVEFGTGLIGKCAANSAIYVNDGVPDESQLPHEANLTVCVPLRHADGVVGAIAVFRLLPQKGAVDLEDRDLFELLSSQAGAAFMRGVEPRASK